MTSQPPKLSPEDLALLRQGMVLAAKASIRGSQNDSGKTGSESRSPSPPDDRLDSGFLNQLRSGVMGEYRSAMPKLRLADGRQIRLEVMYRRETYLGLIMGTPDTLGNDDVIHHLKVSGEQQIHGYCGKQGLQVLPIMALRAPSWEWEPLRRSPDLSAGSAEPREIELLPAAASVATFVSDPIPDERNPGDHSALSLLWFQHDSLVLLDDLALGSLWHLDWNGLAANYES